MRQRLFPVLLAAAAACQPRPESVVPPRDLPPLIPMPAYVGPLGAGSWTPDSRVFTSIEPGAPESYRLVISSAGAQIVGRDSAGLFYGRQTLAQLVDAGAPVRGTLIVDAPRFRYRGMHLDVARHFMPV